jgi:hypothetical protein
MGERKIKRKKGKTKTTWIPLRAKSLRGHS